MSSNRLRNRKSLCRDLQSRGAKLLIGRKIVLLDTLQRSVLLVGPCHCPHSIRFSGQSQEFNAPNKGVGNASLSVAYAAPVVAAVDTDPFRETTTETPERRQRPRLYRAWMLGGAFVLALLAYQALDQRNGWRGFIMYVIAAGLFGFAVKPAPRRQQHRPLPATTRWPKEAHQALGAAVLLLILLLIIVDPRDVSGAAWIFQLAAVALVITAGRLADRTARREISAPRSPLDLHPLLTRLLLVGIVVVGAWVRFHDLGGVPFGFWFDEADQALIGRRMYDSGTHTVFGFNIPAYHANLMGLFGKVFGESIATVRSVGVLFGIGMILSGYLVGRELFGSTGGLLVAAMIATSRWAITVSRIAMHNIMLPFFALLTLGLLLRGHRRQSNFDYALAGVAAGCGMLFYSAILTSLFAFGLFALFLAHTTGQDRRSLTPQVLLAAVGALAVFGPLLKFALTETDAYVSRTRTTALWGEAGLSEDKTVGRALRTSISRYLPSSHYNGDRNGRHNIPGEPMLSPLVGVLSALGMGAVVTRTDRWLSALIVVWFPLAYLPGILSLPWEAPNTLRSIAVLPLAIVVATGAVIALARTVVTSRPIKMGFLGVMVIALGLTTVTNVNAYFDANRTRTDIWSIHSTGDTIAARILADAPRSNHVRAVSFLQNSLWQQYLSPNRPYDDFFASDTALPLFAPPGEDAVLLATHESFDIATQAERFYPNATIQREFEGLPSDVTVVTIPAADIAASLGWTVDTAASTATATLMIDQPGPYRFRLASDNPETTLTVDGFEVTGCANFDLSLSAGLHAIEVHSLAGDAQDGARLDPTVEWTTPIQSDWTQVPIERLARSELLPGGLLATHYEGTGTDTPRFYEIDAGIDYRMHQFVLPRPYHTQWTGGLRVDTAGDYEIFVRTDDELLLAINNEQVLANGLDPGETSAIVRLEAGVQPITMDYVDRDGRSEVRLLWRAAGVEAGPIPIPASALVPWLNTRPHPGCE